jgi:hypothetical protein
VESLIGIETGAAWLLAIVAGIVAVWLIATGMVEELFAIVENLWGGLTQPSHGRAGSNGSPGPVQRR